MAHIKGKYGRATSDDMRELLGLPHSGTLPVDGLPVRGVQGVSVYVKPLAPLTPGQRKRSTHRIIAICECGRHVPVGRLHQHKCVKSQKEVR